MILGQKGFDFIKEFEKLRLKSYKDQAGIWTIGWGTTRLNGYPVKSGMIINEPVADALFLGDIDNTIIGVGFAIHDKRLNQNQIDALISLAYNIGINGFRSSTLVKFINLDEDIFENLFTRWNKVTINGKKVVSNGLTRRRKAEYALFMEKV